MRQALTFLFLFFVVTIYMGCQKETLESSENSKLTNTLENNSDEPILFKPDQDRYDALIAEHQAWLEQMGNSAARDCTNKVTVPDDYPTIGQAIDAVCEGGTVIVKEGTYTEDISIFKSGLFIKAIGEVTVNGVMRILSADNVRIHNFNFNLIKEFAIAIEFVEADGGEAKHNTINGPGVMGILVWRSFNISVKNNSVSNQTLYGILSGTYSGDGYSSGNNMILNNTVTGTIIAGISLQAESDYNKVIGNVVSSNVLYAGILINGTPGAETCDHNVVKNNVTNDNNAFGIWIVDAGHSYNTIGPNNTSNSNAEYGILLDAFSNNNHVFNNTALDNGICDIVDQGGTDNTYKNNTAECTSGF